MDIVRTIAAALGRFVTRIWRYWMADISKRQSFGGKAASIGIGLLVFCCICSTGIGVVRGTGQAVGILATNTPKPKPTLTPVPTNTPVPTIAPSATIAPTPTIGPSPTPEPTATPEPPTEIPTLASQVRTAVNAVLSKSNRKVERITTAVADPDQKHPQIFIRWTINDNLSEGLIKSGARHDAVNILKAIADLSVDYSAIVIEGTFPLVDKLGNSTETVVVHASYPKATIDKVNWPNFLSDNVYAIGDDVTIHPAFQE